MGNDATVQNIIDYIKPDVQLYVDQVKSKPKMTQGHYDKYLSFIPEIAKPLSEQLGCSESGAALVVGAALVQSGADNYAVKMTIEILYDIDHMRMNF